MERLLGYLRDSRLRNTFSLFQLKYAPPVHPPKHLLIPHYLTLQKRELLDSAR